ncbi:ABC transporter permease [Veillonella criceti]|uniref:Glutathione transport system permease protein gsiD n=1 Tax=Veillonella criceti TaxID=103891 RepID=A0A380NKF4_9FIRM|nr:ABC transporter permease [Veillonella criceti]SUP43156.1 Glutathione transport system permease protein gsiD [Veillonella criceti]
MRKLGSDSTLAKRYYLGGQTCRWVAQIWSLIWPGVLLVAVLSIGPIIWPEDPYDQVLSQALEGPSSVHWLGTDQYGRDVLARILIGGHLTVGITLCITFVICIVGTLLGLWSALRQNWFSRVILAVTDVAMSLPALVFAIALAAMLGGGMKQAAVALMCVLWPKYARLARSLTLQISKAPYIQLARLQGQQEHGIIVHHIVPNIIGPIIVTAVLDMGVVLMELAGLSFLGLGATPPLAEWGSMLSLNRSLLQTAPWLMWGPGVAIILAVSSFHYMGERMRQLLMKVN